MANSPISAGSKSYLLWKKETAYNTAVVSDTHFGLVNSFEHSFKNNLKGNRGFKGSTTGGRDISKYTSGKAESELSIEFQLNSDLFLEAVLGTVNTGVYSGADLPPSLTVIHAMDNVTTDRDEVYSGCVVESCSIKGAEGEPVTCSLSLKAAKMAYDATLTSNTVAPDFAPYTFSESTIELPNATVITNVINDFTISIENAWTIHYGNSRTGVYATPGERSYKVSLSTKYVEDALINKAFGGATPAADTPTINATLEIVLTRADNATLTFLFTLAPIDSYNLQASLNEAIGENIEIIAASLTVTKA